MNKVLPPAHYGRIQLMSCEKWQFVLEQKLKMNHENGASETTNLNLWHTNGPLRKYNENTFFYVYSHAKT